MDSFQERPKKRTSEEKRSDVGLRVKSDCSLHAFLSFVLVDSCSSSGKVRKFRFERAAGGGPDAILAFRLAAWLTVIRELNMLMPTADRRKIYEKLFEDGVAIAKKDYTLKSHPEIEGVKNLYVIKALQVSSFLHSMGGIYYQAFRRVRWSERYERCRKATRTAGKSAISVRRSPKSLASRGYVKEQFSWRHYYFYLTDEGIVYLRDYLGLADDVIPLTLKVPKQTEIRQTFAEKTGRGPAGYRSDDRPAYRGQDKVAEAGPGSQPVNYRGGFGRGGGGGAPAAAVSNRWNHGLFLVSVLKSCFLLRVFLVIEEEPNESTRRAKERMSTTTGTLLVSENQSETTNESSIFSVHTEYAKEMTAIIRSFGFHEHCTLRMMADGMRLVADDGIEMQANAYFKRDFFDEFHLNLPTISVTVKTKALLVCSFPSIPIPFSSFVQEAMKMFVDSNYAIRFTYAQEGDPLELQLECSSMNGRVTIATFQDVDLQDITSDANTKLVKILFSPAFFRSLIHDIPPKVANAKLEFDAEGLTLSTHSEMMHEKTRLTMTPGNSESFLISQCSAPTTQVYRVENLRKMLQILNVATKTAVSVDVLGILWVQIVIHHDEQLTTYIDFWFYSRVDDDEEAPTGDFNDSD
ncbi:S10-plectin domain-containing protein [Aphelenchoides fujianensis]|nr:S10-plectin domain-containing protein [Aphelenchoides fujianensis]